MEAVSSSVGLAGRAVSSLGSLFGSIQRRKAAKRWVGEWDAHDMNGRHVGGRMNGAGLTTVTLPPWWKFTMTLTVTCYDCDQQGNPTRQQTGQIIVDQNDPEAATRVGRYLDSAELYEQRLRLLDKDTVLITYVPERCTIGDSYNKHAWRRKR